MNQHRSQKKGKASPGYKKLKLWHKWVSIAVSPMVILFALSGIVLNHRSWFSSVDINRKWLPADYRYHNWNMAAVRGSLALDSTNILIYGNIGVWLTDTGFTHFTSFNQGFPEGIDHRKISKMLLTRSGDLLCGTYFGLYRHDGNQWVKMPLPVKNDRIVDLMELKGVVHIMTRSEILMTADILNPEKMIRVIPPPAADDDQKVSLFKTLWVIHSGEILGLVGQLVVDLIGVVMIFLTLTGLILWLFPGWIMFRKKVQHAVHHLVSVMRFSLRWHNRLGWYLFALLIITTLTGMFLRPPLLIAIANARVGKIPYTALDDTNPWLDRLRGFQFDESNQQFVLSTSEGFYYCPADFSGLSRRFDTEPPVSVMGINVFEPLGKGGYLVGSFSGLYAWFPEKNLVINVFTREMIMANLTTVPFSEHSVAGLVRNIQEEFYIFDFAHGVAPLLHEKSFPPMPEVIIYESPMSFWNFALEIHTGRIFRPFIGDGYILIVPLTGLLLLVVLVTGVLLYWRGFYPRKNSSSKTTGSGDI